MTASAVPLIETANFVSAEELENPPSRVDGIDAETEVSLRIYGCELIQEGCILLKMPQTCAATGQILFHRFYYKVSFKRYDVEISAMAALFLAAKREECSPGGHDKDGRTTLRIKDFVNTWHNMKQRRMNKKPKDCVPINPWGETFADMKTRLVASERVLLKKLGFILFVEHPHKFVIMYCQQLDAWELAQKAWDYCNDSLRTNLCCRYPADTIAVGAIYLAARARGVKLPENPSICDIFHVKTEDIEDVKLAICALYTREKAKLIQVYEKRQKPKKIPVVKDEAAEKEKEAAAAAAAAAAKAKDAEKEGKAKDKKDGERGRSRSASQGSEASGGGDRRRDRRDDRRSRSRSRSRDERDRARGRGREARGSSRDRDDRRDRDRRDSDRDRDRGRGRDKDRDYDRRDRDRGRESRDRRDDRDRRDRDRRR